MKGEYTALGVRRVGALVAGLALSSGFNSRTAVPAVAPCAASPESQQLDYWVGDWTVTSAGATATSTSKVFQILDQCVFVEQWQSGKGHQGQNVFGYSADDKTWRGLFADNEGRVHIFPNGAVASGSAEFDGPSRSPDGKVVLNRIRIVRKGPNEVAQTWEKSADNGATWAIVFRGEYVRMAVR